MKESQICVREVLAAGTVASVERCACGTLHLNLGALTLRIQAEALASLCDTAKEALMLLAQRRVQETEEVPPGLFSETVRGLS